MGELAHEYKINKKVKVCVSFKRMWTNFYYYLIIIYEIQIKVGMSSETDNFEMNCSHPLPWTLYHWLKICVHHMWVV